MIQALDVFREITFLGVSMRLVIAMLCGGLIGLNRERMRRTKSLAGFRTYMLVCVGAALTILISQYEYIMLTTEWKAISDSIGITTDVSRLGAQVINGIGFLGAGTILVTSDDKIKGLTTAAGLWASACMGLAIGAGFYECAVLAVALIYLAMYVFGNLKVRLLELSKVASLCVEVENMTDIGDVIVSIRSQGADIIEMNLSNGGVIPRKRPEVELVIQLPQQTSLTTIMAMVARLDHVRHVHES